MTLLKVTGPSGCVYLNTDAVVSVEPMDDRAIIFYNAGRDCRHITVEESVEEILVQIQPQRVAYDVLVKVALAAYSAWADGDSGNFLDDNLTVAMKNLREVLNDAYRL